jgi:hypothetical protein
MILTTPRSVRTRGFLPGKKYPEPEYYRGVSASGSNIRYSLRSAVRYSFIFFVWM